MEKKERNTEKKGIFSFFKRQKAEEYIENVEEVENLDENLSEETDKNAAENLAGNLSEETDKNTGEKPNPYFEEYKNEEMLGFIESYEQRKKQELVTEESIEEKEIVSTEEDLSMHASFDKNLRYRKHEKQKVFHSKNRRNKLSQEEKERIKNRKSRNRRGKQKQQVVHSLEEKSSVVGRHSVPEITINLQVSYDKNPKVKEGVSFTINGEEIQKK